MDIEIEDRDTRQAMVRQRVFGRDRDCSEKAEPHRPCAFSMMAGWAHSDEGIGGLTCQNRIDGSLGRADRAQGGLI